MIRVSFLYPSIEGGKFDFEYYKDSHFKMVKDRLGDALKRWEIYRGIASPGGADSPFVCVSHLYFESSEAFHDAFALHREELIRDISNFSNIKPQAMIDQLI